MARIAFIQQDGSEWLGTMYVSAMLRARRHETEMFVAPLEGRRLVPSALAARPDIVAFPCLAVDYHWALTRAAEVRRASRALIVFGGTHPTLNPEACSDQSVVDVVCVGEGEFPMAELADAVAAGREPAGIANLWIRRGSDMERNPVRDLVRDLDALPFPDRALYAKYPAFRRRGLRPLHFGRGCPYDCAYCHNTAKRALTRGKGPYVRWRSLDSVMAEIAEILRSGSVRLLQPIDDDFGANEDWTIEFLRRLGEHSPRPAIQANMRADSVTDALCGAMRQYGARLWRLRIAVECGDERYRREVLSKDLSDDSLLQASDRLHRHGIPFSTYNMLGLPGETFEQGLRTLRLNLRLRPGEALAFVYQPYPGTALAERAVRDGQLTRQQVERMGIGGHSGRFHSPSLLNQPEIRELQNLQRLFGLVVRFPALLGIARFAAARRALSPLLALLYGLCWRLWVLRRRWRFRH